MYAIQILAVLYLKVLYKALRLWIFRIKAALHLTERSRPGQCSICGQKGAFICRAGQTVHNTFECLRCGAMARYRALAMVLGNYIVRHKHTDPTITLRSIPTSKHIHIFNTSHRGPLNKHLGKKFALTTSEYLPGLSRGKSYLGVRNENLTDLTFMNNSLDFILTTEVMEHVDQPWKAFREVHRALKPGGCHVFTVPVYEDRLTESRVQFDEDRPIFVKPPEYHRDPLNMKGALVVTDFGYDLTDKLDKIGFETHVLTLEHPEQCIFGLKVFVSRKRETEHQGVGSVD